MHAHAGTRGTGRISSTHSVPRSLVGRRPAACSQRPSTRHNVTVSAAFSPPTVADTKRKFLESYPKPIPAVYNGVVQELLVQQHFVVYSINYKYNPILALGFVSVFDQIMDGYDDEAERTKLWDAYVDALGQDPAKFRADARALEEEARGLSGPEGLTRNAEGTPLQQALAAVAAASAESTFNYNKFFAVGLFRLLELTGAKEPAALERLVNSVGVRPELVNKDLLLYKGILSKLSAAKELMREFLERERKKQAEREAEKAAKAAAAPEAAPSGTEGGATVQA